MSIDMERKNPTSYIVSKYAVDVSTADKWAKANGLEMIAGSYFWGAEDEAAFAARPKPGRRWNACKASEKSTKA